MAVGKGHGIELPEAVSAAQVIPQFRILVTEDPAVAQIKLAGEEGADAEFRGGTDDGKSGGFDADFAGTFPFPTAADGEALRPAEIFPIVGMDEFGLAVVRGRGWRMGVQARTFRVFWRLPRSRSRHYRGRGRGYRSRTTPLRPQISDERPKREGKDRTR